MNPEQFRALAWSHFYLRYIAQAEADRDAIRKFDRAVNARAAWALS